MWPRTFAERLESWRDLRSQAESRPAPEALALINAWWFNTPWTAYHLHWDDQNSWPDPWQLLEDNLYCPLARALGIVYTIALLERSDIADVEIIEAEGNNLVQIGPEKYILNWDPEEIVNINPGELKPGHRLKLQEVKRKIQ